MNEKKKNNNIILKIKNILLDKKIKNKVILGGICILALIFLIIFLCNFNKILIKKSVNNYFDDLITLQFDESQKYLDKDFDFSKNETLSLDNYKLYISKWNVDIKSVKVNKKVALVELKLKNPSMVDLMKGYLSHMFKNDITKDEYYKQELSSKDLKYDTFTGVIILNKINHKWKILNDSNLNNVLLYGANNKKIDINDISNDTKEAKKEKELTEEEIYIAQNLQVTAYEVKEYENYLYEQKPGVSKIALKNNGNKDIKKLVVTIYFQDENGNNISEDSFQIIGGFDYPSSLKANYSWNMEEDKFYEFKNLPNDIDLNKNTIEITEIEFDKNK